MTTSFTQSLRLSKPDFRASGWADAVNGNFDAIDEAIRNILMDVVPWTQGASFVIGQVVADGVSNPISYWICNVTHTSTLTTFAAEKTAHPTYWTSFSFGIVPRGAWVNSRVYAVNDIAYDSVRGITGIVHTAHTSNVSGSILDDSANWDFIVNLPTVFTALATNYDNSTTHLASINVQGAIDLIYAQVANAYIATYNVYDPTVSGLGSATVQGAIDALKVLSNTNASAITANTAAIASGILSTGFPHWRPTAEILTGHILANGLTIGNAASGATSRANADTAALYAWHWNNFSNTQCPVNTGRGANAAADYAANKAITVLDMKGTGVIGIDTMAGAATTRLTSVPVTSGNATTQGSILGENLHAILTAELASHLHGVFLNDPGHVHTISPSGNYRKTTGGSSALGTIGSFEGYFALSVVSNTTGITVRDTTGGAGTQDQTATTGSGTAHNTVHRVMTGNWYLKL